MHYTSAEAANAQKYLLDYSYFEGHLPKTVTKDVFSIGRNCKCKKKMFRYFCLFEGLTGQLIGHHTVGRAQIVFAPLSKLTLPPPLN